MANFLPGHPHVLWYPAKVLLVWALVHEVRVGEGVVGGLRVRNLLQVRHHVPPVGVLEGHDDLVDVKDGDVAEATQVAVEAVVVGDVVLLDHQLGVAPQGVSVQGVAKTKINTV